MPITSASISAILAKVLLMVASHGALGGERSSLRTDYFPSHNRGGTCQGHQALLQRASAVLPTSRERVPLEALREMYSLEWSPPPQPTPPRPASQRGVIEPAGVGAREAARVCASPSARRVARRSAPPRRTCAHALFRARRRARGA